MPTWGAVGLGKDMADVEPEEIRSMYDEALGLPPRSPYLTAVKQIVTTETGQNSKEPGTPMLKIITEIAEPKGTEKAQYNGYSFYTYRVVNEDQAGRVNAFLKALLGNTKLTAAKQRAVLEAFWEGKTVFDKDSKVVTKIGTWTLPEGMLVGCTTRKEKSEEYGDKLIVGEYMSPADAPKGKPAADAEEDDEEPEDAAEYEEEGDDVEPEEEDEEVAARREELSAMTVAKLKTVAKGLGAKLAEYRALELDDLVEFILDLEFPLAEEEEPEEEPEEEEEAEEEAEEEEGDGLDDLDRVGLKKYIKEEGLTIRVTTKMTDDDIREAIRALDSDEEPEEDEEPEPEVAAKPAAKGRPAARRRAGKDEAPF